MTDGLNDGGSNGRWFERESAVSLECKKADQWAGMTEGSCAVIAANERVYNFGFVVRDHTCVVCRAGGTLSHVDVPETIITGPLYINSKKYQLVCTSLNTICMYIEHKEIMYRSLTT